MGQVFRDELVNGSSFTIGRAFTGLTLEEVSKPRGLGVCEEPPGGVGRGKAGVRGGLSAVVENKGVIESKEKLPPLEGSSSVGSGLRFSGASQH